MPPPPAKTRPASTGYVVESRLSKGRLEIFSGREYEKRTRIKAGFLGFDDEIPSLPSGKPLPVSERWVTVLSSQYGCSISCPTCGVSALPFKGNATFDDLWRQLVEGRSCYPGVNYAERLAIHFTRMGEPVLNGAVFSFAEWLAYDGKLKIQEELGLRIEIIHPVLTTMMPEWDSTVERVMRWAALKNHDFRGQACLRLSINSTDEGQRRRMFNGKAMTLSKIAEVAEQLPTPLGRKYCLDFSYTGNNLIDSQALAKLFDAERFICRIHPARETDACRRNGIKTIDPNAGSRALLPISDALESAGFDVLVMMPHAAIDKRKGPDQATASDYSRP